MIYYFKKWKDFMKIFAFINIFLLLTTTYTFAENESGFVQITQSQNGFFPSPYGVAVDQNGNIYVADRDNRQIHKLDFNGKYVAAWGIQGSGNGQFQSPYGVAVDQAGNIYVADSGNNRIQKLDSNGEYVAAWGSWGSDNGQFFSPRGVAIDSVGNIYVIDTFNHRIQKFNSNGEYVIAWGSLGSGNGQFNSPSGVAIDHSGNIYVADRDNHRIQKFNSNGEYVAALGSLGNGNGQFESPQGVAVDHAGNIYVADTDNHRIQKLNSNGEYMATWGGQGSGNGQFNSPSGVAIDHAGNIYVTDTDNHRIQKLNSSGEYVAAWASWGSGNGQFNFPYEVAVDHSDSIYVADTGNHRIQKLNSSGEYVAAWGSYGNGNRQFSSPYGVAVDQNGNIYVADLGNYRIQRISTNGTVDTSDDTFTSWGSFGSDSGKFRYPYGVTLDHDGNIYVADTGNNRIQKLDSSGKYMAAWGSGNGRFRSPTGIAVDSIGNIYVADSGNHRIQKLDSNGKYMATWGILGSGNGQFHYPYGIAVDQNGNIYVADRDNHRIQFMDIPPTVIESTPADNENNIPIDENILVVFSENIFPSDSINMMSLKKDETVISHTYNINENTLKIDPSEDLDYNSTYTVTIPKEAIKDYANNHLESDYTFSFTTELAPYVIDTDPVDNETGIPVSKAIKIIFSEDIQPKDINLLTLKGDTVVDYVYDIEDNILTIDPKHDLDYETLYTVTIPKEAIKNYANNHLESDYTFSFTTGLAPDLSSPYVIDTDPVDNETEVPVSKAIKIIFSEDIQPKDINLLTLKGNTVVDYVCDIEDNTLTIDPKHALDYKTLYTVTIPSGTVQDAVYNPSNSHTFNFTTVNNNADLSNIKLSTGSLNPSFASDIMDYKVNVGYGISSISITPTLEDSNGKVEIDGHMAINNLPSSPISLKVGTNKITVSVTAEDKKTTKVYTITVIRSGDDNDSGGSSHRSNKVQDQIALPNTPKQNDQLIKESLEKTGKAVLSLINTEAGKAKITPDMVQTLMNKEKSLTVENTGIKVIFHPNSLQASQLINAVENLELGAKALTENEKNKVLENVLFGKDTGTLKVGGIFDLTAQVTIKNTDGSTSTEKIESFNEPVAVTIDLSELKDEDIANLTGIRYEITENGDIHPIKLGGTYDKQTKSFTFYTDQFGLCGVGKANKLTTISLTINQLTSKVNNKIKTNDVAPVIINNRTMVPVRFIAENLGAKVNWNAQTKTILIDLNEKTLSMTIDKPIENFDTPPTIVNNRTLVPIRYVSEELDANVLWFPSNKTVYIVK